MTAAELAQAECKYLTDSQDTHGLVHHLNLTLRPRHARVVVVCALFLADTEEGQSIGPWP
jgi:hypothetical protein